MVAHSHHDVIDIVWLPSALSYFVVDPLSSVARKRERESKKKKKSIESHGEQENRFLVSCISTSDIHLYANVKSTDAKGTVS